jgi:hypothetical protein
MRITAFAAALVLLLASASGAFACAYKTASSSDAMASSGQSDGYPQSKPAGQTQPRS